MQTAVHRLARTPRGLQALACPHPHSRPPCSSIRASLMLPNPRPVPPGFPQHSSSTRPPVNTVSHYQLSSNYSISSQITSKFSRGKNYVLLFLFLSGVKNHSLGSPEMNEINPTCCLQASPSQSFTKKLDICLTRKGHSLRNQAPPWREHSATESLTCLQTARARPTFQGCKGPGHGAGDWARGLASGALSLTLQEHAFSGPRSWLARDRPTTTCFCLLRSSFLTLPTLYLQRPRLLDSGNAHGLPWGSQCRGPVPSLVRELDCTCHRTLRVHMSQLKRKKGPDQLQSQAPVFHDED